MANDTVFLIDGFNLYHSVKTASLDLGLNGFGTRWLNIDALCRAHLHAFGNGATLGNIYYFSALAHHLSNTNQGVVVRQQAYLSALRETGIQIELSQFKKKILHCDSCSSKLKRYEEKETDVAIAIKIAEVLLLSQYRRLVIVSGDTDLAPAVRFAQAHYQTPIQFLFPYRRYNAELERLTGSAVDDRCPELLRSSVSRPLYYSQKEAFAQTGDMVIHRRHLIASPEAPEHPTTH